jgi:hypothetical protein
MSRTVMRFQESMFGTYSNDPGGWQPPSLGLVTDAHGLKDNRRHITPSVALSM